MGSRRLEELDGVAAVVPGSLQNHHASVVCPSNTPVYHTSVLPRTHTRTLYTLGTWYLIHSSQQVPGTQQ